MESVPEAERMEEFRPSLLPSLSLPPTRLYRIAATELSDVKTAAESRMTEAAADGYSDADSLMTTAATAAGPPSSAKQYPRLHPLPSDPDDEASSVDLVRKPQTVRRSTDPTPGSLPLSPLSSYHFYSPPITSNAAFTSFSASSPQLPYRPRTTSPLSSFTSLSSSSLSSSSSFSSSSSSHPAFTHTRSRSYASTLAPPPPPMSRTQSLPGFGNHHHILYSSRPASPSAPARPSARARRAPVDECFPPTSPVRQSVLDPDRRPTAAAEWAESATSGLGGGGGPVMSPGGSASGSVKHRRPSSPLRNYHPAHSSSPSLGGGAAPPPPPSAPSSVTSSPSTRPIDSFSAVSGSSSSYSSVALFPLSSIPTTPTSARSRSPSISSLETIPDSPGAEEEALEEERIAQLKAAADAAAAAAEAVEPAGGAGDSADIKTGGGRGSLDVPPRGRTLTGLGFGSTRDKRKRWSVCGAERRGDIDLETIWED